MRGVNAKFGINSNRIYEVYFSRYSVSHASLSQFGCSWNFALQFIAVDERLGLFLEVTSVPDVVTMGQWSHRGTRI